MTPEREAPAAQSLAQGSASYRRAREELRLTLDALNALRRVISTDNLYARSAPLSRSALAKLIDAAEVLEGHGNQLGENCDKILEAERRAAP